MNSQQVVGQEQRSGGRALLIFRSIAERARSSLFVVPGAWILLSIFLSQVATWIDRNVDDASFPGFTDTTVDSARAILGAISSGTITAASVVFSLTLVAIQMSSSVYTSRVLRSFLRDRFQQHMIGILLAVFTYSLLVLRVVRGPLDESGESPAYVPRLSVFIAVLFAIAAVFTLLASISHTSQSLRASSVTRQIVGELVDLVHAALPVLVGDDSDDSDDSDDGDQNPGGEVAGGATASDAMTTNRSAGALIRRSVDRASPGAVLTADRRGWIQQIALGAIADAVPDGAAIRVDVSVGAYVFDGVPLLTMWPPPTADDLDQQTRDLRSSFAIGDQRTLQQDIAFGFTMLEDIANKALSPGVNDPNTATAVIEQLAEVVVAVLERHPPPSEVVLETCSITRASVAGHHDMVVAAFNQIRHFAADQPAVQLVLVRTLVGIGGELQRRRRSSPSALDALRSMLRQVEIDLAEPHVDPTAGVAHDLLRQTVWYEDDGRGADGRRSSGSTTA